MMEKTVAELLADAREIYSVFDRPKQALTAVERALALEPRNVEALNLKAAILYELDDDAQAEGYHRQALEVQPCSVEAWHGLAAIANDRGQYAAALDLADRGFACVPTDPLPEFSENEDYRQRLIAELYNEKAFALWYLGRHADAAALLTEAGPADCPMEVETLEDQLDWLEHHPKSPEE